MDVCPQPLLCRKIGIIYVNSNIFLSNVIASDQLIGGFKVIQVQHRASGVLDRYMQTEFYLTIGERFCKQILGSDQLGMTTWLICA